MSTYVHKKHNVSVLLYHLVCPAKYRRVVFSEEVDQELRKICLEITKRYEITFLEIGTDKDHVHFLIQSIPMYSPTKIARMVKQHNRQRDIQTGTVSEETVVGWRVLDGWILHQYGGTEGK